MIRLLIVDDAPIVAEMATECLKDEGIEASCVRVAGEAALADALHQAPDVVLVNVDAPTFSGQAALPVVHSVLPGVPVIALSKHAFAGRDDLGAAVCLSMEDLRKLGPTVRTLLTHAGIPARRASDLPQGSHVPSAASGTAEHLLERRAALDKVLPRKDTSAMGSILRRTPPAPVALVMIHDASTRERYVKLLRNANIDVEEAFDCMEALARLEQRVHAVLFTDKLALIVQARQLYAGSATHVAFVNHGDERIASEALRAGANDSLSSEARGELFWAHLTTVRRIVGLASSLQLALTDNRILSTIDELTRCASRRFFERQFPREVERAHRAARPLALIMADIDHFKAINDTHGHQVGDEVLREFADRLTHGLRHREDWVARVGGEEFAVVLPETSEPEAHRIAERLCERVNATSFVTTVGDVAVTASFGIFSRRDERSERVAAADEFVRRADTALYESKRAGRNRVTISGGELRLKIAT
jgi:diguanylate cyclase (GGDEF)-like protein